MNKPPHFLIVGAPKAGTTSLYRYLQQHPKIFMPGNKEPRFFCGYLPNTFEFGSKHFHPGIISTESEYLKLFQNAPPGAITGEASTDYLSCPYAAKRIHDWNPETKVIIMLRNSIERAYSEYQHSIDGGFQTKTFWESLCLEEERIQQNYDPIFWHVLRGLYYQPVKEYLELFGEGQVRVIMFDDFARSTASIVNSIFSFLGLPEHNVNVSVRHNTAGERKPQLLQDVLVEKIVRWADFFLGRFAGPRGIYRNGRWASSNSMKSKARDVLTNKQYDYLREKFREDIMNLQQLLHIHMDHWL